MHRHGYQGRKFHRERDQRNALIKGLADSLVKYESIETTLPKAKEVVPYVEKLITKGKAGTIHARRLIGSFLQSTAIVNRLVDEVAPLFKSKPGGYTRLNRLGPRKGDNAMMVKLELVEKPAKKIKAQEDAKTSKENNKPVTQKSKSFKLRRKDK